MYFLHLLILEGSGRIYSNASGFRFFLTTEWSKYVNQIGIKQYDPSGVAPFQ